MGFNKSYKVHFVFKIRRTQLSGHVQALKYTKTPDLSSFGLLIRPTQPNGHVIALKSTKDVRSELIWAFNKTYTAQWSRTSFKIYKRREI